MFIFNNLFNFLGLTKQFYDVRFLLMASDRCNFSVKLYHLVLGFRGNYLLLDLNYLFFSFRKILHMFLYLASFNANFLFLVDKSYGGFLLALIGKFCKFANIRMCDAKFYFSQTNRSLFSDIDCFFLVVNSLSSLYNLDKHLKTFDNNKALPICFVDFSLTNFSLPYTLHCNVYNYYSMYFLFDILISTLNLLKPANT